MLAGGVADHTTHSLQGAIFQALGDQGGDIKKDVDVHQLALSNRRSAASTRRGFLRCMAIPSQ
ncbi:MAG: hypothetical protein ACK56I_28910 [bacterium]